MNAIKIQLNEIKLMQQAPNIYLANYFTELKAEVDLEFISKPDLQNIYSKTIEDIGLFEKDAYKKLKIHKPNNTFCSEIELIEEQLRNNSNIDQIFKSLDELKHELEEIIFSNKTIMFLNDSAQYKQTCLLIIEDKYVRKSNIFNESNVLTRDILIFRLLKSQFHFYCRNKSDAVKYQNTLRVKFKPDRYTSLVSSNYEVDPQIMISSFHSIDYKAFSNLTDLKQIVLKNLIDVNEVNHKSFDGLINLKKFIFNHTKIVKIHFDLFNGLDSLEEIDFSNNRIIFIEIYL